MRGYNGRSKDLTLIIWICRGDHLSDTMKFLDHTISAYIVGKCRMSLNT